MVITLSQTIPACKRLLMHSRLIFQLPFMPFVPSVLAPSSHYHSHKWWEASGQCLVLIHTNTKDTHSRDTYMLGQVECGPLPLLCPWSCHCCVPGPTNCCVPGPTNCCVPGPTNCCVPGPTNCCVPGPTNCCVPGPATAVSLVPPIAVSLVPPIAVSLVPPIAMSLVPPIAVSLVPPIAVSLVPPIAVSLVPPTAGLHYTPMHTDFPPSGVLLSNYGLSAVSTPLAASQVGDTLAHIPAAVLSLTMCTSSLITGLYPWGCVPC